MIIAGGKRDIYTTQSVAIASSPVNVWSELMGGGLILGEGLLWWTGYQGGEVGVSER